jgi:hypothetical protein
MSLTIPYTFTPGTKIKASEANANFATIANKFTEGIGGISDSDIYVGAGIKGSKLSNIVGQRIPYDRIEDGAVTTAKLADLGVTNGKLAIDAVAKSNMADSAVSWTEMDKGEVEVDLGALGFGTWSAGIGEQRAYEVPLGTFSIATRQILAVGVRVKSGSPVSLLFWVDWIEKQHTNTLVLIFTAKQATISLANYYAVITYASRS